MEDIRRQFLLSTIDNLSDLQVKISQADFFSQDFLNEIFRLLHTVKGTTQTFGLTRASRLAHELENLLSAAKNNQIKPDKNLLTEGVDSLIQSLQNEEFEIPSVLIDKIQALVPNQKGSEILTFELPENISNRLSEQEKEALSAALQNGEDLFCLEAGFTFAEFTEGLKRLRAELNQYGNVLAVFPGENSAAEISFRILLSGKTSGSEIEEAAEKYPAEIVFQKKAALNTGGDMQSFLAQITAHWKNVAREMGKNVEFETSVAGESFSPGEIKIHFEALLQLIKNSIDHAIETPELRTAKNKNAQGKIKIVLKELESGSHLTVSDDGSGLDLEKISAKAAEKNLVSAGKVLSEAELLGLIFEPGFSTAENLTEISGRGVGLDAVKEMVENAGGEINIKSRKDEGTTFEIFLPR